MPRVFTSHNDEIHWRFGFLDNSNWRSRFKAGVKPCKWTKREKLTNHLEIPCTPMITCSMLGHLIIVVAILKTEYDSSFINCCHAQYMSLFFQSSTQKGPKFFVVPYKMVQTFKKWNIPVVWREHHQITTRDSFFPPVSVSRVHDKMLDLIFFASVRQMWSYLQMNTRTWKRKGSMKESFISTCLAFLVALIRDMSTSSPMLGK